MNLRSHLGRDFGLRLRTHRLILALAGVAAVFAVIQRLNESKTSSVLLAPVFVGAIWALVREIDPDHNWTAIVGGAFAGYWALVHDSAVSALAVVALMVSARMMSETTGRRPLLSDLVVVGVLGIGVAYTVEGWVVGLGVAGAMFLDDRRAERRLPAQPWIALATAVGATVMAWATGVALSPGTVSTRVAVIAAVMAIGLILRRPAVPVSLIDALRKTPLEQNRLHMSRAVTGIVVYGMAVVVDSLDAESLVPLLAAMALVFVSNEAERVRRKS
jgi:hypothetical protein